MCKCLSYRLSRRKTTTVEEGDYFKIRREKLEKQKKIAKKRNETFLKVGNFTLYTEYFIIYVTTTLSYGFKNRKI